MLYSLPDTTNCSCFCPLRCGWVLRTERNAELLGEPYNLTRPSPPDLLNMYQSTHVSRFAFKIVFRYRFEIPLSVESRAVSEFVHTHARFPVVAFCQLTLARLQKRGGEDRILLVVCVGMYIPASLAVWFSGISSPRVKRSQIFQPTEISSFLMYVVSLLCKNPVQYTYYHDRRQGSSLE